MQNQTKYETDSPDTRKQAEELLKEYYKSAKGKDKTLPNRPMLESWKLREDGVMVVVDGASGKKLEFVTDQEKRDEEQAEIHAEDAETAALDAEAEADALEVAANDAEAKAKEARAKANKKPLAYIDKATKAEAKKK